MKILTEPRNALVKQYQHLFALENAKLTFTDGALRAIARQAAKRDTGARALRAVLEGLMLELLFELPDHAQAGAEYVLDEEAVENARHLDDIRVPRKESA